MQITAKKAITTKINTIQIDELFFFFIMIVGIKLFKVTYFLVITNNTYRHYVVHVALDPTCRGALVQPARSSGRRPVDTMPRCRRAVSVWRGLRPDNQKPTGGGPAEGTAAPERCGITLEGWGENKCASLWKALGPGTILHTE